MGLVWENVDVPDAERPHFFVEGNFYNKANCISLHFKYAAFFCKRGRLLKCT